MRDPERIDRVLGMIGELWKRHPQLRFGQLLVNLDVIRDEGVTYAMEDDDTERKLKSWMPRW